LAIAGAGCSHTTHLFEPIPHLPLPAKAGNPVSAEGAIDARPDITQSSMMTGSPACAGDDG
jgi:hypothetical protein